MVLVDVEISGNEFDGQSYITSYKTSGGTNTQGYLDYQDYGIRLSNFVSRHDITTGFSTVRVRSRAYYIFEGITIPQGAIIDNATLTFGLISENANTTTGTGTVYGRKTASPIPYTSNQSTTVYALQVWTKPVATAVGNFTWSGSPTSSQFTSKPVNVKEVVQELVNTFDYDDDNMMFILQTPALTLPPVTTTPTTSKSNIVTVDNYEEQDTGIPNLTINYTIGGQLCKPVSDISNAGAWEDTTFGNSDTELWNELDEEQPDGTNSAVRSVIAPTTGDTFEVQLEPCTDPISSSNHIIRINARGNGNQVKIQLYQGAGLIAESGEFTLTGAFLPFSYTLSGGEADSITDYNDLRIRVVPSEVS